MMPHWLQDEDYEKRHKQISNKESGFKISDDPIDLLNEERSMLHSSVLHSETKSGEPQLSTRMGTNMDR